MRIVHHHLTRLLCAVVTVALAAGLLASAAIGSGTSQHARSATCPQVNFKANSDDVAFNITTFGTTCATGRSVVDGSAPDRLRPGPNRFYRAGTFSCHGRFMKPVGKWYEHYVCRSTRATIEFDRG